MHRVGEVARGGAHLDRKHSFADQLAGADTHVIVNYREKARRAILDGARQSAD